MNTEQVKLDEVICRMKKNQISMEKASRDEVCSSIRYEAKITAAAYQQAIEDAGLYLSEQFDFQNPYEVCKCVKCKSPFYFKDLEYTGGYCSECEG